MRSEAATSIVMVSALAFGCGDTSPPSGGGGAGAGGAGGAQSTGGIASVGGSGGGGETGTGGGAPSCDSEALEACLSSQRGCELDGGDPSCVDCGAGHYADKTGACAALEGTPLSHEFDEVTAQPGQEILGMCQSWTLGNPEELWVHAVEFEQDMLSHHGSFTFVPDDVYAGPDGTWACGDRGYQVVDAVAAGGILYSQSTLATREVQHFADGAAVRIPPYSRIIGDLHVLNATPSANTGSRTLTIWTLPAADVTVKLVPFHLAYVGLDLPPHAKSRFTGLCTLTDAFQSGVGSPFAPTIYYVLPHTHALGTRVFVDGLRGDVAGQALLNQAGFDGGAHGRAFDPPIELTGATGLRFGCEYENPGSTAVGWGLGDGEMCEVFGFAASEGAFDSVVEVAEPAPPDGDTVTFTGPCNSVAYPWDHDKPGGPGP